MKNLIIVILCVVPTLCFGLDDACTHPNEFTIDKRCYVTDEQKQQKPYNAVVELLDDDGNPDCTGTVVKNEKELYIYTAKHCITNGVIRPYLQNGHKLDAVFFKQGDDIEKRDFFIKGAKEDYVFYKIIGDDENNIPYVEINDDTKKHKAQVVGYGRLKIMSDNEIEKFKNDYIDYISALPETDKDTKGNVRMNGKNGFLPTGELDPQTGNYTEMAIAAIFSANVVEFLEKNKEKYDDTKLKISYCEISNGVFYGCQGWGGNSGGPVFDESGNIIGIASRGSYVIGSSRHAAMTAIVPLSELKNK